MSNILEQMLKASKEQLELEFEHKKELAQIKSCQNNEIKELKQKYKKKISDIEAKIAESEKRCDKQYSKIQRDSDYIYKLEEELEKKEDAIATWQTMYESVVQTCHNDAKEIERLNKQLADTEAQNQRVLEKLDLIVRSNQELEKENQQPKEELEKPTQDKISFAVEQLEQVKYYILTTQQDADYLVDKEQVNIHFLKDVIDNQIKQLKEMK